jgi:hypothetical protein
MWMALLQYIKSPGSQLVAHTALNLEWTACIQGADETPSAFVTRFDMLVNRFKALGRSLDESEIMTQFALKASVSAAETVVAANAKSWADIQAAVSAKSTTSTARQLLRETVGAPQKEASAAEEVAQEAQPAAPAKPSAPESADHLKKCWECGQTGHKRPNCPNKKKKKGGSPVRGAASAAVASDSESEDDDGHGEQFSASAAGSTGDMFGKPNGGFLYESNDDDYESDDEMPVAGDGWVPVEEPARSKFSWPKIAKPTISMHFAKFVLLFAVLFSLLQAGATESVGCADFAAETCTAEVLTKSGTMQNWSSMAKSSASLDWPNAIETNAVEALTTKSSMTLNWFFATALSGVEAVATKSSATLDWSLVTATSGIETLTTKSSATLDWSLATATSGIETLATKYQALTTKSNVTLGWFFRNGDEQRHGDDDKVPGTVERGAGDEVPGADDEVFRHGEERHRGDYDDVPGADDEIQHAAGLAQRD